MRPLFKTAGAIFVFCIPFLLPADIFSASRIDLKNGGRIVTPFCWEEGDMVRFVVYGGTAEVQKELVKNIRELQDQKSKKESLKSEQTPETSTDQSPVSKEPVETEAFDIEAYRNKKMLLQAQLDGSLARLRAATGQKDNQAKKIAREEMRNISAELYNLTEELKEKNKGVLPEDWWGKK